MSISCSISSSVRRIFSYSYHLSSLCGCRRQCQVRTLTKPEKRRNLAYEGPSGGVVTPCLQRVASPAALQDERASGQKPSSSNRMSVYRPAREKFAFELSPSITLPL